MTFPIGTKVWYIGGDIQTLVPKDAVGVVVDSDWMGTAEEGTSIVEFPADTIDDITVPFTQCIDDNYLFETE